MRSPLDKSELPEISGTFTLDSYDTSFNLTTHIVGVLNGTRITMGTTVSDLMYGWLAACGGRVNPAALSI